MWRLDVCLVEGGWIVLALCETKMKEKENWHLVR